MGEINIPEDEQEALKAIDAKELDKLVERAVQEERLDGLYHLPLTSCGPYVAAQLHAFEQALAEHRRFKAPRKLAETGDRLRRAGRDLSDAVRGMKRRMETEEKEAQLFYVDDRIGPPFQLSKHLNVRVSYRWRRTVDDQWTYGSITFFHDVDLRPDYTLPTPKRKLSPAKQRREVESTLYQEWEHLMSLALYSVRDYFRQGGDGGKIPETFQAKPDSYTRGLNNHSADFWRQKP
ncbi:hypothetical protein J2847_006726 [Azospirillum agricola]|uniref:hypothetical protein n=1 Tax=Azospirillum agricola TaxID=1720247 RepID=UPI001AE3D2B5|nr:hypothetical protein [Azospirillum agricola]MBP2233388.1 hypothetical protein [Azospirillum agricola]